MVKKAMTRNQAIRLARKLRREGNTCQQIADVLKKEGYVSDRTGEPVGFGAVSSMTKRKSRSGSRGKKVTRSNSTLEDIRLIINLKGFTDHNKIKIIKSLLDGKE